MSRQKKKKYEPLLFPTHDESWLKFNDMAKRTQNYWRYRNKDGEIMFVIYRLDETDKEGDSRKQFFPISYGKDVETGTIEYNRQQLWKTDRPLLYIHALTKSKITEKVLITEGEKACDGFREKCISRHSELGPLSKYFPTTFSGGCQNWDKTDYSSLVGREVILWPDNDTGGKRTMWQLGRYLIEEFNIDAKIVEVPKKLPQKWDLGDIKWNKDEIEPLSYFEINECLLNAKAPEPLAEYEDIYSDIEKNRWVFIKESRKLYWDRNKEQIENADTLNLLYKRDPNLRGLSVRCLHEENIEYVDGTSYWPIEKEILNFGKKKYLNTYRAKQFEPLDREVLSEEIKLFRDHLKMLCNDEEQSFNYLEDTIASDIQSPQKNRTWAVLIHSKQGVGKTALFKVIEKLNGDTNCCWVHTDNLVDKYRSFMKHCHIIFCNEFDLSGTNRKSKEAKIRELITETTHPIEQKFVDTINHKGHYRLWCSTNQPISVDLDPYDRRFLYLSVNKTRDEFGNDYYKKLWDFIDDEENINLLYHFYKAHKVSDSFDVNEPLQTLAKRELLEQGRPQLYKDLDELLTNRETPFDRDLINTRNVIEVIRAREESSLMGPQPRQVMSHKIDERKIITWIHTHNGIQIKNGQPVALLGKNKRRWWAIRHQDKWKSVENLEYLRAHMNEQVEQMPSKKEQADIPF